MQSTIPPTPSPSLMEIMQAMQLMQAPPAPVPVPIRDDDRGVTKLIVGGVIAVIGVIMLAVFGWVGTSVNGLNTTVTKMSANVDQLQKSIADLQQTQGTATQQLSDIRTQNARQDARDDAIEAEMKRVKDRVRIAEGQKPLRTDTGDL
jgi:Flp pilus assembly pilin Flp